MNRTLRTGLWVVVVAVLLVGVVLAVLAVTKRKKPAPATDTGETVPLVRVVAVRRASMAEKVSVTGSLESPAEVRVCPEVSGRVVELKVEEGSVVEAGEVLARIDQDTYLAQLHQAEAAVAVAEAAVAQAQVTLDNLSKEKDRIENLFREGVATEQQRDDILTRYRTAVAGEKLVQARLVQAQATLELAQIQVNRTTLYAPLSGVIAEKRVEQGDMVSPQVCMFRLVQVSTLKAHFGVSERYLALLRGEHTPAEIQVDAYPEEKFIGTLSKVYPTVDVVTRTATVEVSVPNPERRLKPGMFARGQLVLRERKDVVVVPDSALVRVGGQVHVFVVNNNVAQRRRLRLGLTQGADHEVLEGLSVDDLVVIKGQHLLKDGSKVAARREGGK
ncbi:MAG: efflux RND transporter periplasmic adaptor subunit [Planctomycetes bacterium]|nr:efflux RND transporter periplasmic adaptor subunit [Planctomycetota bacterium]